MSDHKFRPGYLKGLEDGIAEANSKYLERISFLERELKFKNELALQRSNDVEATNKINEGLRKQIEDERTVAASNIEALGAEWKNRFEELLEMGKNNIRREAFETAIKIASEVEIVQANGLLPRYHARLGDAAATQKAIIEALKKEAAK